MLDFRSKLDTSRLFFKLSLRSFHIVFVNREAIFVVNVLAKVVVVHVREETLQYHHGWRKLYLLSLILY
jgi:hypothetical protein